MGTYAQPITPVAQGQRTREQAARERAQAKAVEQARVGNVPTLIRQRFTGDALVELWSVGSRTSGGTVYLVDLRHDADGISTLCDCPAADCCWHRAACRLAHADRIPSHNAQGWRMTPKARPVALPTIGGKPVDQSALTGRRRSA